MANQFGEKIRQLREEVKLLQRQVAERLAIDAPMLSKIENGDRKAKRDQVLVLANVFMMDKDELLTLWLADHVLEVVADEQVGLQVLTLVSNKIINHSKLT